MHLIDELLMMSEVENIIINIGVCVCVCVCYVKMGVQPNGGGKKREDDSIAILEINRIRER